MLLLLQHRFDNLFGPGDPLGITFKIEGILAKKNFEFPLGRVEFHHRSQHLGHNFTFQLSFSF